MSPADRSILTELAVCEPGKGLLSVGAARKRAARRLATKGWAEILEAGGFFVTIITPEGRAALSSGERG